VVEGVPAGARCPGAGSAAGGVPAVRAEQGGQDGLAQPADAYELIGGLSQAAAGPPQLLAQAGRRLAAAALARDMDQARQQLAAVHGGPFGEQAEEGAF